MYTLISGSPKPNNSNSLYFLNKVKDNLEKTMLYELKKDSYEDICDNIKLSHTIILAFPLYVDSPTSITLMFLDYIVDNKIDIKNKNMYVIINCGFREGEQNITGLNIIKRWCDKVGAIYKGSILIGAGEIVGKTRYKLVSKKALKTLDEFSFYVMNQKSCDDMITTMDFLNNRIYCYLANLSWSKKGKKNNLSDYSIRIE